MDATLIFFKVGNKQDYSSVQIRIPNRRIHKDKLGANYTTSKNVQKKKP